MAIVRTAFGDLDGRPVSRFTLTSPAGLRAEVTDYGATLVSLLVPDRLGRPDDVVLGFDTLDGYRRSRAFLGATAGRYANRIRDGRFVLDGEPRQLTCNEGPNHLHGGLAGFDKALWTAEPDEAANAVHFHHRSPDGDEGYPGTLDCSVTYALIGDMLSVGFSARTDRPTLCNLANHSYFNLDGHASGTILDHRLEVAADFHTPVGADLLPTGEIRSVAGTPFDFRAAKAIGRDLAGIGNEGKGYDINLVLAGEPGLLRAVVRAEAPRSGRIMELSTDAPGMQLYTAGYLLPDPPGKGGARYPQFAGFCLETQTFPDSPNFGHFSSARLDPGRTYRHRMLLRFPRGG